MTDMSAVLAELSKPFHPTAITWKPGHVGNNGAALGMAYADLRAYQNRLDEVCGMNWSVSYTPWGDKIICHVTINGVTRSSTGEASAQSEKNEIDGTSAEAQAFKRACAMFGLGRYLYTLPATWADFDSQTKKFTANGQKKLNGVITAHYQNAITTHFENAMEGHRGPAAVTERREPEPSGVDADPADGLFDRELEEIQVKTAKPVDPNGPWPADTSTCDVMAGLIHAPVELSDLASRLIQHMTEADKTSGTKTLSVKQYGLLAGKLDVKYGKQSHRAILSALCGRVVTGEALPGWKVKELIDWLMDEKSNTVKLETLSEVAKACQTELARA